MKQFIRYAVLIITALLVSARSSAQNAGKKGSEQKPERKIWIKLISGETLTGNLEKVDLESVDFTVKNILQTVALDEVARDSRFMLSRTDIHSSQRLMELCIRPID